MFNVVVIKKDTELSQTAWQFGMDDRAIYLNKYATKRRASTRHHVWATMDEWDRLLSRQNTIQTPPLPLDIINEARTLFKNQIDALRIVI